MSQSLRLTVLFVLAQLTSARLAVQPPSTDTVAAAEKPLGSWKKELLFRERLIAGSSARAGTDRRI